MDQLVSRLKKTNAKLIWANTTYVPEKEAGRKVGDDKKYNDVAAKVMKKYGIPINDLYSVTKKFPSKLFIKPGDVHYRKDGYRIIGKQVADKIQRKLEGE